MKFIAESQLQGIKYLYGLNNKILNRAHMSQQFYSLKFELP